MDAEDWLVVIGGIGLIVSLGGWSAAWYQAQQAKQAREALDDKRLDDKVLALIGERFVRIAELSESARLALAQSETVSADSLAAATEARSSAQTLLNDASTARTELQDLVRQSVNVLEQMKDRETEANENAQAIRRIRTRSEVHADIVKSAMETFEAHGAEIDVRITSHLHEPNFMAYVNHTTELRRLAVDVKVIGPTIEPMSVQRFVNYSLETVAGDVADHAVLILNRELTEDEDRAFNRMHVVSQSRFNRDVSIVPINDLENVIDRYFSDPSSKRLVGYDPIDR